MGHGCGMQRALTPAMTTIMSVEGVGGVVLMGGIDSDVVVVRDEECGGYARIYRINNEWRWEDTYETLEEASRPYERG